MLAWWVVPGEWWGARRVGRHPGVDWTHVRPQPHPRRGWGNRWSTSTTLPPWASSVPAPTSSPAPGATPPVYSYSTASICSLSSLWLRLPNMARHTTPCQIHSPFLSTTHPAYSLSPLCSSRYVLLGEPTSVLFYHPLHSLSHILSLSFLKFVLFCYLELHTCPTLSHHPLSIITLQVSLILTPVYLSIHSHLTLLSIPSTSFPI